MCVCRCGGGGHCPCYYRSRIKVRRPVVAAQMRSMSVCCPVGGRRRDGQVIRALSMGWRQCKSGKKCRGQRDCYGATENGNCQHTAAPYFIFLLFWSGQNRCLRGFSRVERAANRAFIASARRK